MTKIKTSRNRWKRQQSHHCANLKLWPHVYGKLVVIFFWNCSHESLEWHSSITNDWCGTHQSQITHVAHIGLTLTTSFSWAQCWYICIRILLQWLKQRKSTAVPPLFLLSIPCQCVIAVSLVHRAKIKYCASLSPVKTCFIVLCTVPKWSNFWYFVLFLSKNYVTMVFLLGFNPVCMINIR